MLALETTLLAGKEIDDRGTLRIGEYSRELHRRLMLSDSGTVWRSDWYRFVMFCACLSQVKVRALFSDVLGMSLLYALSW